MKYGFILPITLMIGFGNVNAGNMGAVDSTYDFAGLYVGLGAGYTSVFVNNSFATTRSDTSV